MKAKDDWPMNLTVLNKSRRGPEAGDIFVMLPPDGLFLYGCVISTEARIGPMTGCILIYVYKHRSTTRLPVPELSPDQILISPIMTNRLPWRRGYFETVVHKELGEKDRLKQHCFRDSLRKKYFDEFSHELDRPIEPTGIWGLASYGVIDYEVSKALGFPLPTKNKMG
jgi:hypothetical protein